MGRHAADEGADVHPIVAAALHRQAPESPTSPRHDADGHRPLPAADGEDGDGLGWPGPPPEGTDLGWPAGARTDPPAVPDVQQAAIAAQPARRRLGWRRLFGAAAPARAESSRSSSVA